MKCENSSNFCLANYLDLAIFADNLVFKSKKYEKPNPMGWMLIKNILSLAGGFLSEADNIMKEIEFKNFIMKKAANPRLIQKLKGILTSVNEREVVYIGDSLTDLEFAENANINFIAISGRSTKEEFKRRGARFIVDSHLQIIDLIENLQVKVIIFDFDGTLVSHWPARYKAYCDKLAIINKKLEDKIQLKVLGDIEFREILRISGFGHLPQATIAAILMAEGLIDIDQLRDISKQHYLLGRTRVIAEMLDLSSQNLEKRGDMNRSKAFKEYVFSTWSSIFESTGEYYEPQIDDTWEDPSYFFVYRDVPSLLQELYPKHIICLYSSRSERATKNLLNFELKVQA